MPARQPLPPPESRMARRRNSRRDLPFASTTSLPWWGWLLAAVAAFTAMALLRRAMPPFEVSDASSLAMSALAAGIPALQFALPAVCIACSLLSAAHRLTAPHRARGPAARGASPSSAPPAGLDPDESPSCPECSAPMVRRMSRTGGRAAFWGCSAFPKCHGTRRT